MDKINKVPSKNTTVDSIIEKIKDEISKNSDEDLGKTRKLTMLSTVKNDSVNESTNDIDRQISDLENIIKKLQNEIVEMSNKSEKSKDYISPDTEEKSHNLDRDIIEDNLDSPSRIFPVVVNDSKVQFTEETEESRKFDKTIKDLLNRTSYNNASGPVSESFSVTRKNFSQIFQDKTKESESVVDEKLASEDNISVLINELKAEISEKMEELKDVDTGQPLNSSKEDMQ
ncbi:uncharacterized protein LOC116413033 [Galleria mellonella]|uniref:Uncharacterized protein LOC116413033 n=1 Tax=Galleria mellonella TaxID=7137 RepID=A0A6J3C191_GALME|nr:uncharacterized protein LOC116413033 [Galleria mellonella]